ncbi:hypothetical protein BGY98DRAFT_1092709 [Russula aff. rugulosa BPL654]|nr:hypothetical protein BGY98DRAFT_1092709 [Russula aff. rugulosa BPL654]
MALDPLPPPPPETLTLKPTLPPPKKPPDPSITVPFPERTPYRAPENPFRGPITKETEEEYKRILQEVTEDIRAPFSYDNEGPLLFDGESVGVDLSSESFNAAVITVLAAVERGYYPARDPTPISARDWARLACSLVAAIGRGYHRQNSQTNESTLEKVRKGLIDPNPLASQYPTLFHRLSAMAEHLEFCLSPDLDNYQDWYGYLRHKAEKEIAKLATIEVEEKWREWKADQIDRRAAAQEAEIAAAVRNRNAPYFMSAAMSIGLSAVFEGPFDGPRPVPTTGKKRTASGAAPNPGTSMAVTNMNSSQMDSVATPDPGPATPRATRSNPPRAAKRSSPLTTPRGRLATPVPVTPSRTDPSPTPRSKKAPTNPVAAIGETGRNTPSQMPGKSNPTPHQGQLDAKAIMGAIQAAMNPFMMRLNALERASMPPPQTQKNPRGRESTVAQTDPGEPNRTTQVPKAWPPPSPARPNKVSEPAAATRMSDSSRREDQEFTTVRRRSRRKKGGNQGNSGGPPPSQPSWINITPASYAGAAAAAVSVQQPNTTSAKTPSALPSITEVTVIRHGGHTDHQVEQRIRVRAADAIVREVQINMAKAVAKPIPLRAGRWSIQPRSKGNFVYSFNGHIPFDVISSYEHILLGPFQGSGQLCPSLGWTRLLAHGVPVMDNDDTVFRPEALLAEVRSLPGLKKAFFAMPPRWLRPIERLEAGYSSITFAISDPDGAISSNLLKSRAALFGKEVKVQKWIDKPALIQCSRCHALGHSKASRACPLGRNSVKCYICGGAHRSEEHDQCCTRKHTVAGICDCTNFKCLNCQKPGHHCREEKCPSRSLFRPRNTRRAERARDKGKGRDPAEGPGLPPARAHVEEVSEPDHDLFNPPPAPPNPSGPQTRAARRHADAIGLRDMLHDMDVDSEASAGPSTSSTAQQSYSPSRPQPGAASEPVP